MALEEKKKAQRNPGPTWGFAFLNVMDDVLPDEFVRVVLHLGAAVAVKLMPDRRKQSEDYLRFALGREPTFRDVVRHFSAFSELLIVRLRVSRGLALKVVIAEQSDPDAVAFLRTTGQGLFGSFHFGHSDLLGFLLTDSGRKVAMVRTRVGNSEDTEELAKTFSAKVQFVWVNDPSMALFAIKESVEAGLSIAMQCDRVEFSSRLEPFEFLGASRQFPFTIYHLSLLFQVPVVFCMGVPLPDKATAVFAAPIFRPTGRKSVDLPAARAHFQTVISQLESLIRQNPYLWFNFLPLNPVAAVSTAADRGSR